MSKFLVVILGPTAVGKTAVSIDLAIAFHTEILSADSRQFYKELNIGVAKPIDEQLATVTHHFINHRSIHDEYNAGKFESDALKHLDDIFKKHDVAIMVGGSGLYIQAVCQGFDDLPKADAALRRKLQTQFEEHGIEYLQNELEKLDAEYFKKADIQNPQRVMRALEVCITTGKPFSSFHQRKKVERPFKIIKLGLNIDRKELYSRINQRVDDMINQGLLEEVKALKKFSLLNSLQTVGYQELFDHLNGKMDLEKAVDLIKQNSRRYAKRQLTWFNKDAAIKWFHTKQIQEMIEYLNLKMKVV